MSAVSEGSAPITVTVRDSDGDSFDVRVPESSDIVALYEANGDGKIDYTEWGQAKQDSVTRR